jgi:hypothetical protein
MSEYLTPIELQQKGMEILVRELGYADAVRFMLQYCRGRGDYTKDRRKMLAGATLDELLAGSRRRMTQAKDTGKRGHKAA